MRRIDSATAVTAFGPSEQTVARVSRGECFRVRAEDCYDGQIPDASVLRPGIDMARFNRASGPIFVEGIAAGARAAISIHDIAIDEHGVMALAPGMGVLGERIEVASTRILEIRDGRAWLTDSLGVELAPMIGVIGCATAGAEVPTSTPGEHGGNLDTRHLRKGTVLVLRSRVEGLGLALGDLHAVQGDGELGGTGVEIGGEVTLSVDELHEAGELPVLVDGDGVRILASATTLEGALSAALAEAVQLMAAWHRLDWDDAYRLTSIVADAEVSQIVNPLRTGRIRLPLDWLRGPYRELAERLRITRGT